MKKSIFRMFPVLILFFLLLNPALSLQGAKSGLLLWFNTVLPTLLPFMLCSNVIVVSGSVSLLTAPFFPFLSRLGLSRQGSYALLCGLLCGYPMGPKTAADLLSSRAISLSEAKLLLAVSAWPSPMFLSGYVYPLLEPHISLLKMLICVYLPLLPLSLAAGRVYGVKKGRGPHPDALCPPAGSGGPSFDALMMNCLEIMAKIGGYLMMFSILAAFLNHFFSHSRFLCPCLAGAVEMTTGIREISASMTDVPAGAAMVGAAVFGGLSGIFQVSSVIKPSFCRQIAPSLSETKERGSCIEKNAGLSIRHYVLWKLAHTVLSIALFILLSLPD